LQNPHPLKYFWSFFFLIFFKKKIFETNHINTKNKIEQKIKMAKIKTKYPDKPEKNQDSEYIYFSIFSIMESCRKLETENYVSKLLQIPEMLKNSRKITLDSKNNAESIKISKWKKSHCKSSQKKNRNNKTDQIYICF